MANLLPRDGRAAPFEPLDPERLERVSSRLGTVRALHALLAAQERGLGGALPSMRERLDDALEEVEAEEVPPAVVEGLLEEIDAGRRAAIEGCLAAPPATGDWVLWWPGRSLETGEAEVASRGLFDVRDRPPLACWIETVARPAERRPGALEVAVLAWVPPEEWSRARAGCAACPTGALAWLDDVAPALARQLASVSSRQDPIEG